MDKRFLIPLRPAETRLTGEQLANGAILWRPTVVRGWRGEDRPDPGLTGEVGIVKRMRGTIVCVGLVVVLALAGCGGGDDSSSGYTRDDIASALGLHNKHHEVIYEMAPGKDCVVIQFLTSSDEVKSAQSVAGDVPTALAVNSSGDAGVIFAGFGTFSQDQCVAPAESDLNSMSSE